MRLGNVIKEQMHIPMSFVSAYQYGSCACPATVRAFLGFSDPKVGSGIVPSGPFMDLINKRRQNR